MVDIKTKLNMNPLSSIRIQMYDSEFNRYIDIEPDDALNMSRLKVIKNQVSSQQKDKTRDWGRYIFPVESVPSPILELLDNKLDINTEERKSLWLAVYNDIAVEINYKFTCCRPRMG